MLASTNTGDASPALDFVFALFCFSLGVIGIVAWIRQDGMNWSKSNAGVKVSIISLIAFVILFFTWGIAELDSAFHWDLFTNHEAAVHFVPLGFVIITQFYDRYFHS